MPPLRVSFLGTGDAFCAAGRHHASYLVTGDGSTLLLDCGATTLASLQRGRIDATAIDLILISHLHGDHFCGLPFLFLEYIFERPRQRPLRIAGPPGTEERVYALFRAAYKELAAKPLPFALEFTEMLPDQPVTFGPVHVEPFRVPHQEREISLGLRVGVAGRTLLYSGDTGWTDELIVRSADTDLFICECCFFDTRVPYHLDYPRIAEQRARLGTKRLILTHLGREVLARRHEVDVELATEGLTIEV